jgi:MIP family channel proteins
MSSEFTFRECFSEMIGTLCLIFFSGFTVILMANQKLDVISVAMANALSIAAFMWAGSGYSKCHFNPAITVGLLATKKIELLKSAFYVLSQFVGSYLGAIILFYVTPESLYSISKDEGAELGGPHINKEFNPFGCLIMELLGTFLLMLCFCVMIDDKSVERFSLAIGFIYGLNIFTIGEITGAAINPFKYFGPALLNLQLSDFYVYFFGPFIGAVAASFFYYNVIADKPKVNDETVILKDLSRIEEN